MGTGGGGCDGRGGGGETIVQLSVFLTSEAFIVILMATKLMILMTSTISVSSGAAEEALLPALLSVLTFLSSVCFEDAKDWLLSDLFRDD